MDLASVAAGCMTVELTVPRILAFAFIELGLVGQAVVQARVQIRPPPGARRQALLGVFLT